MRRWLSGLNPRTHRRMRVVLPFATLLVLVLGTLLVHALEQPDPGDPGYLDPGASGGTGSDRLAAALRAAGTEVVPVTGTEEALDRVREKPGVTLFVPAPSFVDLQTLSNSTGLPPDTRIVVAGAELRDLERTGWPIGHAGARWAAKAVEKDCALPLLPGPAAVLRQKYATPDGTVCYGGGLVAYEDGAVTVILVGAADPFRNDRIGEHANQAFATAVLGGDRVVWLDLHERENRVAEPEPSESTSPSPFELPSEEQSLPAPPPDAGTGTPAAPPDAGGRQAARPPLTDAFPAGFWATLVLAALALLALAAAAARRLGAPVAEPLPSRVPAHETMLGHARLYQRARARGPSLDVLRAAARRRLAEHLGLPRDASVTEIAGQAGLAPDHVRSVLGGDSPETDADLVAAARAVQDLVRDVTRRPITENRSVIDHRTAGGEPS
ncbi:DUF4350 domain-containing protein [Actinoplanes sp. NPDC023936]|uniref:DUF4350 domain-containing protein n=1 Tax=Actinoplanes sp. NPDC023936 TaxID=3154910 RepID=UPI0033E0D449